MCPALPGREQHVKAGTAAYVHGVHPVDGAVDPRFAAVGDAFRANFDDGELGAACTVVVDGRVVVDLWGGWSDLAGTRPWARDTLVDAYSVGKPIVALSVLQLVAGGRLDLDERADAVWPELRAGQLGATVRDVLCHRAGVMAVREPLTNDDLWDWDRMCAAIAGTEPWWPPGSRHTYHTNTYGFLTGELAHRVTGELPSEWLRRATTADLMWAVPDRDLARCADVQWDSAFTPIVDPTVLDTLTDEQRMILLGYANPAGFSSTGVVNTRAWRQAQVPSTNLHATARGVAQVYAELLDGTLLDPAVRDEATSVQSEGWCPVLEREVSFGLGFQPTRPDRPFGPNPGAYGHFGTGGAVGFADPVAGIAFGYVMNAVKPRWQSSRNRRLIEAVYSSLS
jgi:CubicO group peptidase (beta-lactamase class C family)